MGIQAVAAKNKGAMSGRSEVIQTLEYLSRELSGLDRLVFAAEEMVRILQTDWPRCDDEVQEKVVHNISVAKETLTRHEISIRPFVSCGADLAAYRNAYFDMLSTADGLIGNIRNDAIRLNLRRLTLPLNSSRRFSVRLDSSSRSMELPRGPCPMQKYSFRIKTTRKDTPPNMPLSVVNSVVTSARFDRAASETSRPNYDLDPSVGFLIQPRTGVVDDVFQMERQEEFATHIQPQCTQFSAGLRVVAPVMSQLASNKENKETWRGRNLGVDFEAYLNSGETYGFDWFMRRPPNGFRTSAWPVDAVRRNPLSNPPALGRISTDELGPEPACTIM